MKRMLQGMLMLVATVALIACGGSETPTAPDAETNSSSTATEMTSLTLNSADGAAMAYVETSLEATAGEIELTFNNKGALPHNVAIVPQGQEEAVNQTAQTGAPEYKAEGALAQTATIEGGNSDTITFELEPGTYTYFCTFPGHLASGMKGTLVVK